jgi:urease accessory protein
MLAASDLEFPAPLPASAAAGCPLRRQDPPSPGEGRLEVELVDGQSAVVGCAARSPLQLLAPCPRGRAAWVVAASHGGGLVGGDAVELAIRVGAGAAACLGTQAETKVYRPAGLAGARQRLSASLGEGALLALLPDPVSPYAGARYDQVQRFDLAAGASLALLDAVTAGRAARGERWAFARYCSRNEVRAGGRLLLADAIRLGADEGPPLPDRLEGLELLATVLLLGPALATAARALLAAVATLPASPGAAVLAVASPVGDGALLRLGARSVEEGMAAVRRHLAFLAGPLDGDPLLRRP